MVNTITIKKAERTKRRSNRYTYDVYDGGFWVATWEPKAWSARGYLLYDITGDIVRPLGNSGRVLSTSSIEVDTIAEMVGAYERNKDAVPTCEQLVEREKLRLQEDAERKAYAEEQERLYRISQASEDLYKAAKTLIEQKEKGKSNTFLDFEPLRAAIDKAEGK